MRKYEREYFAILSIYAKFACTVCFYSRDAGFAIFGQTTAAGFRRCDCANRTEQRSASTHARAYVSACVCVHVTRRYANPRPISMSGRPAFRIARRFRKRIIEYAPLVRSPTAIRQRARERNCRCCDLSAARSEILCTNECLCVIDGDGWEQINCTLFDYTSRGACRRCYMNNTLQRRGQTACKTQRVFRAAEFTLR